MKKQFALHAPNKAVARVIDSIKHEVNKYVSRERRKPLPEGFDQWEFLCKVGATADTAENKALKEVGRAIDAVAAVKGAEGVYVEVVFAPAQRSRSAGIRI